MAPHKPTRKFLGLEPLVFVNLIQAIVFSFLTGAGDLQATSDVTKEDYTYGIPSFFICVEQVFFALLFHYTYSRRYAPEGSEKEGVDRMSFRKACLDALNPNDYVIGLLGAVESVSRMFRKDKTGVRQYHFKKCLTAEVILFLNTARRLPFSSQGGDTIPRLRRQHRPFGSKNRGRK